MCRPKVTGYIKTIKKYGWLPVVDFGYFVFSLGVKI
jgi:hypothetical protein